jgi:hypothetical protein
VVIAQGRVLLVSELQERGLCFSVGCAEDSLMSAKRMKKKQVGVVTRFFSNIGVAAIKLEQPLRMGSKVSIEGPAGTVEQVLDSMQINRKPIQQGAPGQEIAIKVKSPVKENDMVFVLE